MDTKVLRDRLDEIRTEMMTDALQASVMLSAIIRCLDDELKPLIPDWSNSQGIIDPDMIDDNTFDNGPKEIEIVRIHQVYTNACHWEFRGVESIQNDSVLNKFLDHMGENHSYEDDGEHVPDEYMLKVLIGRDPERKVLNAFLNGQLRIAGLDETKADQIFRHWRAFYNTESVHQGFMCEEEGHDT